MMDKLTPASGAPISIPAPGAAKAKPESSQETLNLRKYPKPMREKVIKAIENMERWLKFDERDVDWKTSLDDFRANRSSGITNPSFVMTFHGDTRVLEALYLLDKAFEELHSYRPEDHLTQGVVSIVELKLQDIALKRDRKNGASGGRMKAVNKLIAPMKAWAVNEAKSYPLRTPANTIAKELYGHKLPDRFKQVDAEDPQRIIAEAIRADRKTARG